MATKRYGGWSALFVILSGAPVLLAALFPPEGWRILGGIASPDDVSVYLAAMYQGRRGLWLYYPAFDPSPTPPLLIYPFYMLLGKLAGVFHIDLTLIYHAGRLLCGVLVLAAAGLWARSLFEKEQDRLSAWLLVAFSSGIGWLLAAVPSTVVQTRLADLRLPETNTFLAAFTAPHFSLGIAAQAVALFAFWRATTERRWFVWSALSGVALVALGLSYLYTLPLTYLMIGLYVMWAAWREGRPSTVRALRAALVAGGIPLPLLIYYVQTFFFNPFWNGTYVSQNEIPTPEVGWLLAGYGLPLLLAIWGGVVVWKEREKVGLWSLVGIWAVVQSTTLYLPLTFQWRLANGLHFALALLAGMGIKEGLIPWLRKRGAIRALHRVSPQPIDTVRRAIVILTVPSTLMVVLLATRIASAEQGFPYYAPRNQLEAMDELANYVSFDDVVLGAYQTGNILPGRAFCRVVVGHQDATLDATAKLEDVTRFFDAHTSDTTRRAILSRYDVTVVYYGRWERELGDFNPSRAPYLTEWVRTPEMVVYRVTDE